MKSFDIPHSYRRKFFFQVCTCQAVLQVYFKRALDLGRTAGRRIRNREFEVWAAKLCNQVAPRSAVLSDARQVFPFPK